MKKYFLWIVIFTFFQAIITPTALAAKVGETCGISSAKRTAIEAACATTLIIGYQECLDKFLKQEPNIQCDAGLTCDPDTSVCTTPPQECTCQQPGTPGPGNNGFTCGQGPVIYCASESKASAIFGGIPTACNESDGTPIDTSTINFQGNESVYAGRKLVGVLCSPKKNGNAICKCNPDATGAGTFSCYKEGESATTITATGTCKDAAKCVDAPGQAVNTSTTSDYTGFLNGFIDTVTGGFTISGIKCNVPIIPSRPPLPPVPPPPCAPDKLKNGICEGFLTAFGEIATDTGTFIQNLFSILLALSGGIAVLLIMRAGYTLMTSAGNSEKVQSGRDQLVAAIVGLLFIIFSFVILQVIGVEILRIPGFS